MSEARRHAQPGSTTAAALPESTEVVIIGGGIMGTATAHHLAKSGVGTVLLERDSLGSGSTSRAAGGVRTQFSDETNIRLGMRSMETFADFRTLFDTDIDLVRTGYLFLLDSEADAAVFERNVALQNACGTPSRMLTVAEACALSPAVDSTGLVAGAFNPLDGHCTPEAAVAGFARAARAHGARILTRTEVLGIDVTSSLPRRITGVHTTRGPVACSAVVCAAGAWSARIGAMVGVDLPVTPLRRQIMVSGPVGFDAAHWPFTIDFSTAYYFHPEGAGLLFGCPEATPLEDFDQHSDTAWLETLGAHIARRTPRLAEVGVHKGWAGLYENTPDHNALIGVSSEVAGFSYACGFSGHGFLQGPAVGEVMADLYLGREPVVDVSGLSAERFATDHHREELNIV